MKPNPYEPCWDCKHWVEECELGRHDSSSMVIFNHCGFCEKRSKKSSKNVKDLRG